MRLAVGVEIAGAGIKHLRKIVAVRGEGTTAEQQSCMTANGKPRPQRRSAPWSRPDTRTAAAIRAKRRTTPFIRQSVRVLAKPFALNREPSQSLKQRLASGSALVWGRINGCRQQGFSQEAWIADADAEIYAAKQDPGTDYHGYDCAGHDPMRATILDARYQWSRHDA